MDERHLHDLRNDLNVIALGLALLQRQLGKQAPADALETLHRIERVAQRCQRHLEGAPANDD